MAGVFPLPGDGILSARSEDEIIFVAEEPQYNFRTAVHPFWSPLPQDGMEDGEGSPGPSFAHPARSGQQALPGAWSAESGFISTKPETSRSEQHREVQNLVLEQLIKQLT